MLPFVDLWNKWDFHILVVLSFTLQVILLLVGGIRRRKLSYTLRIFLWIVYLSADSTATYTLGLMASSRRNSGLQQLVAFWAPFLLLHLGGQDTVTAYALEDNELWLRHLFSLVVQGFGATYILYKYISAGDRLLTPASILVFVVGLVKYGERIWALKRASMSSMQESIILFDEVTSESLEVWSREKCDDFHFARYRIITSTAHSVLGFIKPLFVTPSIASEWRRPTDYLIRAVGTYGKNRNVIEGDTYHGQWVHLNRVWRTVDLQLSLMYDLLYTKSAVIHTGYGYIMRALSLLAILSALVLFIRSSRSSYGRGDVAVTYVLLVGACVLEIACIVRVIGSTWTSAYLTVWGGSHANRFAGIVLYLRWCFRVRFGVWISSLWGRTVRSCRYRGLICSLWNLDSWPDTCMGQYNIISSATTRPRTDIRWRIARLIGQEDLWMNAHHSTFIQASPAVVRAIYTEITRRAELTATEAQKLDADISSCRWTTRGYEKLESLSKHIHAKGLIGFIISCHIATDILVRGYNKCSIMSEAAGFDQLEIAMVLSNYMMYLLRVHKDILPTITTQHSETWTKKRYDETFTVVIPEIIDTMRGPGLHGHEREPQYIFRGLSDSERWNPTVRYNISIIEQASILAKRLLQVERQEMNFKKFQFLADLWVDTLLYVADGITAGFHAKQLSYGGEFVTVVSVLMANVGLLKQKLGERQDSEHTPMIRSQSF